MLRGTWTFAIVAVAGCEKCEATLDVQMPTTIGVGLEVVATGQYCDKVTCWDTGGLTPTADIPEAVFLEEGGYTIDELGQPIAASEIDENGARITATAPGPNALTFDSEPYPFEAFTIERISWELDVSGGGEPRESLTVFQGTSFAVRPYFMNGDEYLSGRALVELSPAGALTYVPADPYVPGGSPVLPHYEAPEFPAQTVFSSPVAPETLTVEVVDLRGVLGIELQDDAMPIELSQPFVVDSPIYLDIVPLDGRGEAIIGDPGAVGTVEVVGSSIDADWLTVGSLRLLNLAPGDSTVRLTWGSATVTFLVRVP